MIDSDRLTSRMNELGMSQSKLARLVGVSQASIWKAIHTSKKGSAHLHRIARELRTTPAYLTGETDDPDENAPPPPPTPTIQFVTLQVALPDQRALARMFEGLLLAMPDGADLAEQADLLAERLPIGLAQLRDLLPIAPAAPPAEPPALVEAGATPDRESR